MIHRDAGIGTVSPSPVFIVEDFEELTHMRIPIDVSEQIEQEQAGRVIAGRPIRGVTISHEGSDKGEIDQGGDHSGISTLDCAIRKNLNEAFFKAIV
jgi:hypothetical protein